MHYYKWNLLIIKMLMIFAYQMVSPEEVVLHFYYVLIIFGVICFQVV